MCKCIPEIEGINLEKATVSKNRKLCLENPLETKKYPRGYIDIAQLLQIRNH